MAMRTVRGIERAVQIPCMPVWHASDRTAPAERGWLGDEEAMQATQCYQRLHVFSLENQNLFQPPHSAAETMCVLNKRNEWNRWALPLVMSALGALDGRRFQKLSPVLLCFVWFCFNLIWNIVEGNYQARPLYWLSVNQKTNLKVILNPST